MYSILPQIQRCWRFHLHRQKARDARQVLRMEQEASAIAIQRFARGKQNARRQVQVAQGPPSAPQLTSITQPNLPTPSTLGSVFAKTPPLSPCSSASSGDDGAIAMNPQYAHRGCTSPDAAVQRAAHALLESHSAGLIGKLFSGTKLQ